MALTRDALTGIDVAATIATRRANYLHLRDSLELVGGVTPLFRELTADAVPLNMPVVVEGSRRNAVVRALQAEGIGATPWWAGYHRGLDFSDQPGACFLKDHILALPTHQHLGSKAIDHIAKRLSAIMADHA